MLIYVLSRSESLYSTKRIYTAGTSKKHNVRVIDYLQCDLLVEDGVFKIIYDHEILLKPDFVVPRIGASVTGYGCAVVRHFEKMGASVLNSSDGIINSRDKFRCHQLLMASNIQVPRTYYSYDLYYAERVVRDNLGYPFILKVLEGTQGIGVYLVRTEEEASGLFKKHITKNIRVLLQEFIAEFEGKDLRLIVIGDEVVASMMRMAQDGDFRSNIHRGGKGEDVAISHQEKEMAIRATKMLGLQMAGVDLLRSARGPMIIEVNSSPGIEGIEGVTQQPVAEKLIDHIEKQFAYENS